MDLARWETYLKTFEKVSHCMRGPKELPISYLLKGKGRSVLPSHRMYSRMSDKKPAEIFIFDESSMEMLRDFKEVFQSDPLVLVFASCINPFGGIDNGGYGQLEDWGICSDLFDHIEWHMHRTCQELKNLHKHAIFFPRILFLRDENFEWLQEPFTFSCFMASAVRYPKKKIVKGKEYFEDDRDRAYTKYYLDMFFRVALLKGKRSVIIGAPGCGSYDGPVHEIAKILKELVETYQYYFDYIGFPILVRNERDERNLAVFKETFTKK